MARTLPAIALPALPKLPPLPGGHKPLDLAGAGKLSAPDDLDEFGLGSWARPLNRASRRYIGVTYRYFGFDGRQQPVEVFSATAGTVPESVTFGWLLTNGYTFRQHGPRGFDFQGSVLGGRAIQGGGAVVDFIVYRDHLTIAVRVESPFHTAFDPFGRGGVKARMDFEQGIRLKSMGGFNIVMSVNLGVWGFPLSNGPADLVDVDLGRIERITPGGADAGL